MPAPMRDTEQKVQEARKVVADRMVCEVCYGYPATSCRTCDGYLDALIAAVRKDEREVCALALEHALPVADDFGNRIVSSVMRGAVQGLRDG